MVRFDNMDVFDKPLLFKIHVWLQPIGRTILLLGILPFILAFILKDDSYIYIVALLFFSGAALTWIGFFIALTFKCPACGRKPSVIFKQSEAKYIYKPKGEMAALINDFYPIEIRENKFQCVYCGAKYSLKNKNT
jgi:hypothetical protein